MTARLTRLLVRLSGADPQILRWVPEETSRFAALGGTILSTAAVVGLSAVMALTTVGVPLWAALPAAVGWAALIALLDRTLVASLQRSPGRARIVLACLPRLLLALLLGPVVSTPLVLRMFQPELDAELALRGIREPGLLDRLEALDALTARSSTAGIALYALVVLFVLVEVLPVLVGVLRLFGPVSTYERVVDIERDHRAAVLSQIIETRAELTAGEREYARQLTEMLDALGPPPEVEDIATTSDEQDGARS